MTTLDAYDLVIRALETCGCNPSGNGTKSALCPVHELDGQRHSPSLSVSRGDKGAVIKCQRGCPTVDVVNRLGLTMADLFDEEPAATTTRPKVAATYPYTDETGTLLFQAVRMEPKDFRQRRPDGNGGWIWNLQGTRRVIYRLPAVLDAAKNGQDVWVVEGEKDVHALERAGVVATCNPMGAGKWVDEYADALQGAATVYVVADRDEPGRAHARDVGASLRSRGIPYLLYQAAIGKDAADHLGAAKTLDEFVEVDLDKAETNWQERDAAIQAADAEAAEITDRLWARLKAGSTFILDDSAELDPVWGAGDAIAWASGESLIIGGPTGVGKTTMVNLLIAARLGIVSEVLGWSVKPADRPILLLAMDRPNQARRALRRLFGEQHRQLLEDMVRVWPGPPPSDLGKHPEILGELVARAGAGTVILDSLKDAAVKLTDDEVGGNVNRGMQMVLTDGSEVVALHHQRKGQGGNKPRTLEDVYGSTWITAGAGSVILLWGAAGDPLVELNHLKQPVGEIGPLKIEHHAESGTMSVFKGFDALRFLTLQGDRGATAIEAARAMFEKEASDNEQRKARRLLDALVSRGLARRDEPVRGGAGGATAARYYVSGAAL